jgi:hypothetical protein
MAHYDKDHLTATYDDATDTVVMEWYTFAEGEPFREGLDAGLDLVKQEGAENWLADLKDLGTVDQDDQEWSNQDWFPRAMETTLTNMAIVQPESVVANMSVENIMQEVGDGAITTHYFDDRAEAEDWLAAQ